MQDGQDARWMLVSEAAEVLGVSKDAVRKKIKRGTIKAKKDHLDRWMVLVEQTDARRDASRVRDKQDVEDQRIALLEDQVRFLREELTRKDQLMWELMQKVPQLEQLKQEETIETERPQKNDSEKDKKRPFWKFWE